MSDVVEAVGTDRPDEYPFLPYHEALEVALRKLRGRPLYCAVNAVRSLRRAWKIAAVDPEMAAFRAITAEEEAATALIFALQRRKYPRADELDPHKHPHKAGFSPFLRAVESMIAESSLPKPQAVLRHKDAIPRIDISFQGEDLGILGNIRVTPEEPLHGVLLHSVGEQTQAIATFSDQLQTLADGRGVKDIAAVIRAEANLRNQILYAADDGVPGIQNIDAFLLSRRRPVSLLLSLTIVILQTKKSQLFAVQALDAYLQALGKVSTEPFDYAAAARPQSDWIITVRGGLGTPPVASIQRHFEGVVFCLNDEPSNA